MPGLVAAPVEHPLPSLAGGSADALQGGSIARDGMIIKVPSQHGPKMLSLLNHRRSYQLSQPSAHRRKKRADAGLYGYAMKLEAAAGSARTPAAAFRLRA